MKVGDRVHLRRTYSELNGWSIRPGLDGKWVEIVEIEDRPNGCITAKLGKDRLAFFRDAVSSVVTKEFTENASALFQPMVDEMVIQLENEIIKELEKEIKEKP